MEKTVLKHVPRYQQELLEVTAKIVLADRDKIRSYALIDTLETRRDLILFKIEAELKRLPYKELETLAGET